MTARTLRALLGRLSCQQSDQCRESRQDGGVGAVGLRDGGRRRGLLERMRGVSHSGIAKYRRGSAKPVGVHSQILENRSGICIDARESGTENGKLKTVDTQPVVIRLAELIERRIQPGLRGVRARPMLS